MARKPAPKGESKRDRFVRLANARATKAVTSIQLLGNLTGAGYEFTEDDRAALISVLNDAVTSVDSKFTEALSPKEKKEREKKEKTTLHVVG
jgi:hypothetical protein